MHRVATRWLVAGALAAIAVRADAQQTVNMSASITIPTVLYLNATSGGGAIAFASPTESDFNTGYIQSSTTTQLAAAANVRHSITIWTDAASMTGSNGTGGASDPVNAAKPTSDLTWSTGGAYAGVVASSGAAGAPNASAAKIVTQRARGDYRAATTNVTYRMSLSYATDTPGKYDLAFYYTIIAD